MSKTATEHFPEQPTIHSDTRTPRAIACILLAAIGGTLLSIPTVLHILGVPMAGGVLVGIAAAVCGLAIVVLQQVTAQHPRQESR